MTGGFGIRNIKFSSESSDLKKNFLSLRNRGDTAITVEKTYVNESIFDRSDKIDSLKSQEIEEDYTWTSGKKYKIKIATTTGLISEISSKSP